MSEEEAKAWAKDKNNQQQVINACIKRDAPKKRKAAIFMAGIPGAGKTEFVRGMRAQSTSLRGFVVIEHDKLVEHIDTYTPGRYYDYRKAGSTLVTALFNHCLARDLPFIFDGTLSHDNARRNIKKALKHGYEVVIVYIHQDIKSAWQLTQDRELVKKRAIEREGFIQTAQRINDTLSGVFSEFYNNNKFSFWVMLKNGTPGTENANMIVYEGSNPSEGKEDIESILNQQYNVNEID